MNFFIGFFLDELERNWPDCCPGLVDGVALPRSTFSGASIGLISGTGSVRPVSRRSVAEANSIPPQTALMWVLQSRFRSPHEGVLPAKVGPRTSAPRRRFPHDADS